MDGMGQAMSASLDDLDDEKRSQVLAFNNGVPSQVGVILSGVLLILGGSVSPVVRTNRSRTSWPSGTST